MCDPWEALFDFPYVFHPFRSLLLTPHFHTFIMYIAHFTLHFFPWYRVYHLDIIPIAWSVSRAKMEISNYRHSLTGSDRFADLCETLRNVPTIYNPVLSANYSILVLKIHRALGLLWRIGLLAEQHDSIKNYDIFPTKCKRNRML